MLDYLKHSFFPNPRNVGRLLIGILFLVTGIKAAFGYQEFLGKVQNLRLPMPRALAMIAIGVKIIGGISVTFDLNAKLGRLPLIIFTSVVTYFMYNPFKDSSQIINFGKNMAIIGGLLLID